MTKISVAMATYNGEQYIEEQLASIAAQTLLPCELVVCDDGSDDCTVIIIRKFAACSPFPVRLKENRHRLGITKNFEKAIRLCSGELIALADQDDVWMADKLEKLSHLLLADSMAGYAFSDAVLVDAQMNFLPKSLWEAIHFTPKRRRLFTKKNRQPELLVAKAVVTGATMLFRAGLCEFFLPLSSNGIHDHWISLALSSHGLHGIATVDKLIAYRQHDRQAIGVRGAREDRQRRTRKKIGMNRINAIEKKILFQTDMKAFLAGRITTNPAPLPTMNFLHNKRIYKLKARLISQKYRGWEKIKLTFTNRLKLLCLSFLHLQKRLFTAR